jgi:hypothetical protein
VRSCTRVGRQGVGCAGHRQTDVFGDHDAFGGESAVLDLAIDNPLAVVKCGRGDLDGNGKPLQFSQVSFSSAHGSQISITP